MKLKVKAKKIEETPEGESIITSQDEKSENPVKIIGTKEKKSSVAIIWSPKEEKKKE